MFRRMKPHLDEKEYSRSLISKDDRHRFYDQLRSHNKRYEVPWFCRFVDAMRRKKRNWVHNRTIKDIERRNNIYE